MVAETTDASMFAALCAYDIMDTPEEAAFDRLTAVAAHIFDAPVSLLAFLDGERMWVKSGFGIDARELPRAESLCTHTLDQFEMVALDTHEDGRVSGNPLVTGERGFITGSQKVRFYAGVSLVAPDGSRIGTICVIDAAPRVRLAAGAMDTLRTLAKTAIDLLDGRRQIQAALEAARRTQIIDTMKTRIAGATRFQPALEGVMCSLGQLGNSTFGQLWLRSGDKTSLRAMSTMRDAGKLEEQNPLPFESMPDLAGSLLGDAIRRDQSFRVTIRSPGQFEDDKFIAEARALGLSHLLVVPFLSGDADYVVIQGFTDADTIVAARMRDVVATFEGLRSNLAHKADEERLHLLGLALDMAPDGVLIIRPESVSNSDAARIVYVNDSFCRMSGYATSELVGQTTGILDGTEEPSAGLQRLRAAGAAGRACSTNLVHHRKDGTTYSVEVDMAPIVEKGENPSYFVILHRDITAQLAAELKQVELTESFRLLFERNPLPMWVYNGETGRFLMVNQAAIAFYGWSREQFMTMTLHDIRPASEWELMERFPHVGTSSMSDHRTWVHKRADGSIVKMYGVTQSHTAGEGNARLSVFWDVTEIEAAREELKRNNARLLDLTQQLSEKSDELAGANGLARLSTWRLSSDLTQMTWSDEMYRLIDRVRDEFPPSYSNTLQVLHAEDRSPFEQAIRLASLSSGNNPLEVRVVRPDGRTRHVRIAIHPASTKTAPYGLVGYFQDISEQWETQQSLMRAERLAILGQLTGGVAHDFNNLLTVVTLNLEEAIADLPETHDLQMILTASLQAAQRGAELTSQLLAYARQAPLRPKEVSLGTLFETIGPMIKRALGPTYKVQINIDNTDSMPLVDASQLESAVLNVALNARDAMSSGGEILVKAASVRLPSSVFPVDHATPGDYVLISIADRGCGIKPADLPRIFEPFYTTKEAGSGLGLSMVDGFVAQSSGHVTVESEVGQGTTIRLFLPMAVPSATKQIEPAGGMRKRALLVDDQAAVLATVSRMFTQLGYEVTAVGSAAAALAKLDQGHDYDLMFTDIVLPGEMDGIALCKAVVDRLPKLRVLMTSGFSDYNTNQSDLPGAGILMKPYKRQELLDRLNAIMAPSCSEL